MVSGMEVKLMTYGEVAAYLQMSDRKVWGLVNEKKTLEAIRVGRQVRITSVEVERYLESLRPGGE